LIANFQARARLEHGDSLPLNPIELRLLSHSSFDPSPFTVVNFVPKNLPAARRGIARYRDRHCSRFVARCYCCFRVIAPLFLLPVRQYGKLIHICTLAYVKYISVSRCGYFRLAKMAAGGRGVGEAGIVVGRRAGNNK